MKESSTYQAILDEGRTEGAIAEAKKLLRLLGEQAFGAPDAATAAAVERLDDLGRLEDLLQRMMKAGGWRELLRPAPAGRRRWGRRQSP